MVFLRRIMCVLFFACLAVDAALPRPSKRPLTAMEKIAYGSAAGMAEAVVGTPLSYAVDYLSVSQQARAGMRQGLQSNFLRTLYHGVGQSMAYMVPMAILKLAAQAAILRLFSADTEQPLHNIAVAMGAGVVCAAGASPFERTLLLMRTRAKNNLDSRALPTIKSIIQEDGVRGLGRGFPAVAGRDALWVGGWLGVNPALKTFFNDRGLSPVQAAVASALVGGLVVTGATQWLSTIRSRQFEHRGRNGLPFEQVFREIVKKDGIKGLNAGFVPRGVRIILALLTMSSIVEDLPEVVNNLVKKQ